MVFLSRRGKKGLLALGASLALIWVFYLLLEQYFDGWALSVATGLAMIALWPVMNKLFPEARLAGVIYKIDSERGLKLIRRLGDRYSRLWVAISNFALVALFGGLGSAFVAAYLSDRQRRYFAALFSFSALYALLSQSILYPTQLVIILSLPAAVLAILGALATFYLISRVSKLKAVLVVFVFSTLLFASPYIVSFMVTGNAIVLINAAFVGILGPPGMLLLQFLSWGFAFLFGLTDISAFYPALPSVENGVPVLKDPGGLGISMPIVPDLLIAFILLLILHEGFHGLVARAHKIRLKHTGIMTLSILPLGAFVEPDEEQFRQESPEKRARVFVVGSFANIFVLGTLSLLVGALLLSSGAVYPVGITPGYIVNGSAAAQILSTEDVIYSIGGEEVATDSRFREVMGKTAPEQMIEIRTDKGTYDVVLGTHPDDDSIGYFGMAPACDPTRNLFSPDLSCSVLEGQTVLFRIIKILFLINIMVGLFNLLPIPLLDGYGVYNAMFQFFGTSTAFGKKYDLHKRMISGLALIMGIAIFLNIVPYVVNTIEDLILLVVVLSAFILTRAKFRRSASQKKTADKKKKA